MPDYTAPSSSASPVAPKRCVYTVLFGGYEELSEQPVQSRSELDFLCLTDDPGLRSDTWDVRLIEPFLPADAVRSAREPKILAHEHLAAYDVSLYIDNRVRLDEPPEAVIDILLPGDERMGLLAHSFRETVEAEFEAVIASRLDSLDRCTEQLAHLRATQPDTLRTRPLWAGLMARRHHDPVVVAAMERWFAYVLRYSRRDQLSLPAALAETGLTPNVLGIDNATSSFHRWPILVGRKEEIRTAQWPASEERVVELEGILARERAEAKQERAALMTELEAESHERARVTSELSEARREVTSERAARESAEAYLAAMTSTKTFRLTAPARNAYGWLAARRAAVRLTAEAESADK